MEIRSVKKLNPSGLTQRFSGTIAQIAVAPPGARLAAISGQVALDASGALVGGTEHAAQARQCFANICEALAALNARPRDILQMRIYVVGQRQDFISVILGAGYQAFGGDWPICASMWIGVEALASPEWLVEVDALVAVRPAYTDAWG